MEVPEDELGVVYVVDGGRSAVVLSDVRSGGVVPQRSLRCWRSVGERALRRRPVDLMLVYMADGGDDEDG